MIILVDLPTDCLQVLLNEVVQLDFSMYGMLSQVCTKWKAIMASNGELRDRVFQLYQSHISGIIPIMIYSARELYLKHIGKFHNSKRTPTEIDHYIQCLNLHHRMPKQAYLLMFKLETVMRNVLDYYQVSNFAKLGVVNLELIAWSTDPNGIYKTDLERALQSAVPYTKKIAQTAFLETFSELIRLKYPDV
jgi:hypothetical protein